MRWQRMVFGLLILVAGISAGTAACLQHPKFGKLPEGGRLFSGDTGYGPHFAAIAQKFSGFDLVALDMGQYALAVHPHDARRSGPGRGGA